MKPQMTLLEPQASGSEFEKELVWFSLEGNMNVYFHSKGLPIAMRCEWINDNTMRVTTRGYVIALFLKDCNELYRVEGSLQRQWTMVKSAFEKQFPGLITPK